MASYYNKKGDRRSLRLAKQNKYNVKYMNENYSVKEIVHPISKVIDRKDEDIDLSEVLYSTKKQDIVVTLRQLIMDSSYNSQYEEHIRGMKKLYIYLNTSEVIEFVNTKKKLRKTILGKSKEFLNKLIDKYPNTTTDEMGLLRLVADTLVNYCY